MQANVDSLHQRLRSATHGLHEELETAVGIETQLASRDRYVGYLARQTVKHLQDAKMISTEKAAVAGQRVGAALVEELALEDLAGALLACCSIAGADA